MGDRRLKRRSSLGLTGRKDTTAETTPAEVNTPVPFTQATDDEEERRARNIQRRHRHLEAGMSDSPELQRQDSAGRRSVGAGSGGGLSSLTAAQLAEHYNNCIKLSAENKISAKNAFNLQLIDYMASMIKKKESDMDNFQVAAGTLDASTKIYAYRVDSVYGDTLKIAGGLGQAGKQEQATEEAGQEAEEDLANHDKPKKKRRLKKSATVEKNLKNINLNKFDLEFQVDPLFKKTSAQFDGGSGGKQFIATLLVKDDSNELLLDSNSIIETTTMTPSKSSHGLSDFTALNPSLLTKSICPSFEPFSFKWSLQTDGAEEDEFSSRLNQSITASQEERLAGSFLQEENAFDAGAVPEPLEELRDDDYGFGDDKYGEEAGLGTSQWSERVEAHAPASSHGFTSNLSTADLVSVLTTAPLEYSYFDTGKLGAWAGPKHWKFKPITRSIAPDVEKSKGRKKKVVEKLDYMFDDDSEEMKELIDKVDSLLKAPKRSVKLIDKTMKSWNRDRSTLPEDLHYSGHQLVKLKSVEKMVIQTSKQVDQTRVDDGVEDYNYENAADKEDYCPDSQEQGGYGDDYGDDQDQDFGDGEVGEQEGPELAVLSEGDVFAGDNLVEAPKIVDKAALHIGYAKTAKKVDMKRIKNVAWTILNQASKEEKENMSASPEKQVDKEGNRKEGGEIEETSFSSLYKSIKQPSKLPKVISDNLSVPLAFIALLHLCNEKTLELIPSEDMEDFDIRQG